ncbi:MAG: hypothetical protein HYZ50_09965 [Deltaproteobacteria bacterium]|nr:hypothetical protein [Deltaproteobacteria bacterium]
MTTSKKSRTSRNLLTYTIKGTSRSTIRRYCIQWRQEQKPPLPERCDNSGCWFHTHPLVWNDQPLKPILDHTRCPLRLVTIKSLECLVD